MLSTITSWKTKVNNNKKISDFNYIMGIFLYNQRSLDMYLKANVQFYLFQI